MPDPAAAEAANHIFTMIFGTTAGGGAIGVLGKILFDQWKDRQAEPAPAKVDPPRPWPAPKTPEVPHAGSGFLTLDEIEARCCRQQAQCTKMIRTEFELIKAGISARLDRGDRQFDTIETKLADLVREIRNGNGRKDH